MVTKLIELYEFDELGDAEKERAKREWLYEDSFLTDDLDDMIQDDLNELFPNSTLTCYWQLAYCQGDGFSISGTLSLFDLDLTDDELEALNDNGYHDIQFDYSKYRCESVYTDHKTDTSDDPDIDKILQKMDTQIGANFKDFFDYWREAGYAYLYEWSDERFSEYLEANGFEAYFKANGSRFKG